MNDEPLCPVCGGRGYTEERTINIARVDEDSGLPRRQTITHIKRCHACSGSPIDDNERCGSREGKR